MAQPKKFTTEKKYYKKSKDGRKREPVTVYNGITFDDIVDWLEENGTDEDKKVFKDALYTYKDGAPMPKLKNKETGEEYQRTNFINAKRKFFERHNPEYIPVKKEKETIEKKSKRIAEW